MRSDNGVIGETGLKFFGKISASISHEIRNALAIINESAGLLKDLATLGDGEKSLDPERIASLAQQVMRQIRRADGIIDNMNAFAHSVDEPIKQVDLKETVNLMSALCQRFATLRMVKLAVEDDGGSAVIFTNPFLLENLIWLCLDFAMQAVGEGKTVLLTTEGAEKDVRLKFGKLEGLGSVLSETFPGPREKALLEALAAEMTVDVGAGELVLVLSREEGA